MRQTPAGSRRLDDLEPDRARQRRTVAELWAVPRWVAPLFAVLALAAVPWIGHLAITLPRRTAAVHYRSAWVGFDIGLTALLALTAYLAWRGRHWVALAASACGTMLLVDAWFDVVTTPRHRGLLLAVILAVVVELPLAGLCFWIAVHTEDVALSRSRSTRRPQP